MKKKAASVFSALHVVCHFEASCKQLFGFEKLLVISWKKFNSIFTRLRMI